MIHPGALRAKAGQVRCLVLLGSLLLAGCGFGLDGGTYRFTLRGVEEDTCGRAVFLPGEWEGILLTRSRTLALKFVDPFFLTAVGGRSLVGRGFPEQVPESLIADASFPDIVPFVDVDCPAFARMQVAAAILGEDAFSGRMAQIILVDPQAPAACPVQCATTFFFEARRVSGETELPLEAP